MLEGILKKRRIPRLFEGYRIAPDGQTAAVPFARRAVMADRKYQVRGTDEMGDVWTFSTNDRDRAEEILAEMRNDLASVRFSEDTVDGESERS